MKIKSLALSLTLLAALAACASTEPYDPVAWGVNGGLGGGAIGAGTGAIIGSSIANGDVVASTIVGGAIGVPVGALLAVGVAEYERGATLREARAQVETNSELIAERNEEIDILRQQLQEDSFDTSTNPKNAVHLYPGTTLGPR